MSSNIFLFLLEYGSSIVIQPAKSILHNNNNNRKNAYLKGRHIHRDSESTGFAHHVRSLSTLQVMDLVTNLPWGEGWEWRMPSETIIKRCASWG